jgi:hypothetical protein
MDLKIFQEMFFDYFSGPNYWGSMVKFYVYKNPTIDEWNDFIPKYARGWISPEGNLYIEGDEGAKYKNVSIIHTDLLKSLVDKGVQGITSDFVKNYFKDDSLLYNIKRHGLLVQRKGKENKLMFSEVMAQSNIKYYPSIPGNASILYSKLKRKCPYLSFQFWNTGNENDEEENDPWHVNEEFFDYTKCIHADFYLYVNPTIDEIRKFICRGSRGYIAPTGDLYMEGYEEKGAMSYVIHNDIFNVLANRGIVTPEYAHNWFLRHSAEGILREGLAIQRFNMSNKIAVSESINGYTDQYRSSAQMLFDRCKRKGNTFWDFVPTKIYYLEP